jgi:hypothetical protein
MAGADPQTALCLAQIIEEYLAEYPGAALLEGGRVLFDMRRARYRVGESHGRCLIELWSDERNLVRTVLEVEQRAHSLRILTRKMGAPKSQALELVANADRRTPTAREAARRDYQRLLERVLTRRFAGAKPDGFRSAMDLEHSFGPAYVRGRLVRGTAAEAVIGVSTVESSAIVDGVLTLGVLWLEHCRQHSEARRHFGGLKVVVPAGAWRTTAERMAWLNHAAASFELYALDERTEELEQIDFRDTGNLESRLVHAFSSAAAMERCKTGLDRLMRLVPAAAHGRIEVKARSAAEVVLLLHGLEFARVRHAVAVHSFAEQDECTFGAGANETSLTEDNEAPARAMFERLFTSRHPDGTHTDALFRLQPERWLEAKLRSEIAELMPGLRGDVMYSQVPALTKGERGMLDLLTLGRDGRLTVIEVKADEDLHLPLQALDYWIRVRALNADRQAVNGGDASAFERQGYFAGAEVSRLAPRLLLVAPALRIHPANDTVLRYFSPEVEWELIALAEPWRRELKVVFRKRSAETIARHCEASLRD